MSTLSLAPRQNTEQKSTTNIASIEAATASGQNAGLRVPLFVPRNQLYYWTREWQQGEAEALKDIAAGRVREFLTGSEAAAWLLSDE